MENAAEALKLAGWVLIFVLALSLSMNALSEARQSIDQILIASDRDYVTTYVEQSKDTHRIVGAAQIVPTIYRAYRENFKVRIVYEGTNWAEKKPFYQIYVLNSSGERTTKPIFEIDLENQNLDGETEKEYFLRRILFGEGPNVQNNIDRTLENNLTTTLALNERSSNSLMDKDFLNSETGFYGFITSSGNKIYAREELGVYLQEEVEGTVIESTANKTEKRVVTYYLKKE